MAWASYEDNVNPPDHVAVVLADWPRHRPRTPPVRMFDPAGQQCRSGGYHLPRRVQRAGRPAVPGEAGGYHLPRRFLGPGRPTCPVTDAIKASLGPPGLVKIILTVTNSSDLPAACHYDAKAKTNNPLVPKEPTRDFKVPANGKDDEEFNGAPTNTTYDVTIACKDASGKQTPDIGDVSLSLKW